MSIDRQLNLGADNPSMPCSVRLGIPGRLYTVRFSGKYYATAHCVDMTYLPIVTLRKQLKYS